MLPGGFGWKATWLEMSERAIRGNELFPVVFSLAYGLSHWSL